MSRETFFITFKFPVQPGYPWITFSARVEEYPATGIFKISDFHDRETHHLFPIKELSLKKLPHGWVEKDQEKETLVSAVVGQAISKRRNSKDTGI